MTVGRVVRKNSIKQRPARVEYSAGGIVFRRMPRGIEIAFIEDPWHKWTFAKGHIKKRESIVRAAVRETQEEMGVRGLKPIKPLGRTEIWFVDRYVHKGSRVHKYIYFVLMEAPYGAKAHPQKRELIHAVHWVPLSQALRSSNYKDVRPVLQKAIQYLHTLSLRAPHSAGRSNPVAVWDRRVVPPRRNSSR